MTPPSLTPQEATTDPPVRNQLLERVVGLLSALAQAGRPTAVADLARDVGLPVSTTYRLVQDLERYGLVAREGRGAVTLGLRALDLARTVEDRVEQTIVAPAYEIMQALAREHGETAILTAAMGQLAIGLASIESPAYGVRLSLGRWSVKPIHLGASGKILLAHLDTAAIEGVLRNAARSRLADGSPVDVARLRDQLAAIRRDGYVVSDSELDEGATAAAAAILDAHGRVAAGLTLGGPTSRIRPKLDAIVPAVVAGAGTIAARLAR